MRCKKIQQDKQNNAHRGLRWWLYSMRERKRDDLLMFVFFPSNFWGDIRLTVSTLASIIYKSDFRWKKQKRTHTRCFRSVMRPCVWSRRRGAVMVNTAKVNGPQQTNSSTVCSILHTVFTFSSPAAWCVCVNNDCPLSYVLSWQDLWHCYTVRENFTTGGCGGLLDGCNKTILLLVWAYFSFYHFNKQSINVHISTHFFKLPNAAIWTLFKKKKILRL